MAVQNWGLKVMRQIPALLLLAGFVLPLQAADKGGLPIRRVILYKNGVGYFERSGRLGPKDSVRLAFKAEQMSDVLKSLTLIDHNGGKVSSVSYDAKESTDRLLSRFSFRLNPGEDIGTLLDQLKGARVRLLTAEGAVEGSVIGVRRVKVNKDQEDDQATLLLKNGEMKNFFLSNVRGVKLLERNLQEDLERYLEILSDTRRRDLRTLTLRAQGKSARDLVVNYLVETPVWKTSYRLILDGKSNGKNTGFLQGWALVDNTSEDDWENVQLSLVAGRPISFIQDLYTPLYARRPIVGPLLGENVAPAMHEGFLDKDDAAEMKSRAAQKRLRGSGFGGGIGRGKAVTVMNAPAPAAEMMAQDIAASTALSARAQQLGELFEYKIGTPVTILRNRSSMIPILQSTVEAERVSIFNRRYGLQHPRRGVRLKNSGGLTLDGGPMTVVEDGAYGGEALVETIKAGETRLVSYAVDLGCRVGTKTGSRRGPLMKVKVQHGNLIASTKMIETQTYTIRNLDAKSRTLLVEHPVRPGWKLATRVKPAETTPNFYRFRIVVEPKSTKKLRVTEEYPLQDTIRLTNLSADRIAVFLSGPIPDPVLRQKFEELGKLKRELAVLTRELKRREGSINEIHRDQDRVRKSLMTVRQIPGQQAQMQRYLRKLADQENRIETLQSEIEERRQRRAALQTQVDEALHSLG